MTNYIVMDQVLYKYRKYKFKYKSLPTLHRGGSNDPKKICKQSGEKFIKKLRKDTSFERISSKEAKIENCVEIVKELSEKLSSQNVKHLLWIIESYISGGISLIEDVGKVDKALTDFGWLVKNRKLTEEDEKFANIHQMCGINGCETKGKKGKHVRKPGLYSLLDRKPYKGILAERRKEKERDIEVKEQETKKIFESDKLLVIQPLTKRAAIKYGSGNKWCNAGKKNNMFDNYNKDGPIYIIVTKQDNKKYQLHFESGQFMDEKDEPEQLFDFPEIVDVFKNIGGVMLYKFVKSKEDVDSLVQDGIDIHKKDSSSNNPAHILAKRSRHRSAKTIVPLVFHLIDKGINVNETNKDEETVVHI